MRHVSCVTLPGGRAEQQQQQRQHRRERDAVADNEGLNGCIRDVLV